MSVTTLLQTTREYLNSRTEIQVRSWFDEFDWDLPARDTIPQQVSGCRHLPELPKHAGPSEIDLISAFIQCQPELLWRRSYSAEDFGQHFFDNYGFVELAGQRGHYACEQLAIGFVLFGKNLEYPSHWHVAEELYFPLTGGTLWSRDGQEFVERKSGEFVFHTSNMPHAMIMKAQPLLALYVWQSPPDAKADLTQKSYF